VRSWIGAEHQFPVLRIRYEDVLADGVKAAGTLCRFLGLARERQDIEAAVARASFERLREIEEADIRAQRVGIFYKPYLQEPINSGLRFMRSGKTGEAARVLSQGQQQRFNSAFGSMRRELGYA
jgi:3-methyladenine DNA glycosylase Mpg